MRGPRKRFIATAGLVAACVLGLIFWSLSGTTAYYKTPTELASETIDPAVRLRVAGIVVKGSVMTDGTETGFSITDGTSDLQVTTNDLLPDTFGEGVEVVAEGGMGPGGEFDAHTVLAKCPSKFKAKTQAAGD